MSTLIIAGSLSLGVAVLHVGFAFVGSPAAYRYFGAGETMARMAESGSIIPGLVTLGVALLFGLAGLYGLAGAGMLRPPPFLRLALIVISGVYLLRGLLVIAQILWLWQTPDAVFPREIVFSLISLGIGLFYLAGTAGGWQSLAA